jgi:hypothetical protein
MTPAAVCVSFATELYAQTGIDREWRHPIRKNFLVLPIEGVFDAEIRGRGRREIVGQQTAQDCRAGQIDQQGLCRLKEKILAHTVMHDADRGATAAVRRAQGCLD